MQAPNVGRCIIGVQIQAATQQYPGDFDGNVRGGVVQQAYGSAVTADNRSTIPGDGALVIEINAAVIWQRLNR